MIYSALIKLWDKPVGAVSWESESGIATFEYEPSFLKVNWEISPIMMPLNRAEHRVFLFPELRNSETFKDYPDY
jgi:serine/threonine-protein kinase HipA